MNVYGRVYRCEYEHSLGLCRAALESPRRDGQKEYRHVHTRPLGMPSAMPMFTHVRCAAMAGHLRTIEALVSNGAAVDAVDEDGWTGSPTHPFHRHAFLFFKKNLTRTGFCGGSEFVAECRPFAIRLVFLIPSSPNSEAAANRKIRSCTTREVATAPIPAMCEGARERERALLTVEF